MATISTVGQSFALDGREACIQAIEQARQKILHEADHIVLAFIFASREYNLQSVLSGASAQLRNTPLFGFSTEGQLTASGQHLRSVVVALLAGSDISVQANWWSDFSHDSRATTLQMIDHFGLGDVDRDHAILLISTDGVHGDSETLCKLLPQANYFTVGCLTGGNDRQKLAYQIGGEEGGEHGLGAVLIQGNLKAGVGIGHGWQPLGKYFYITQAEDLWIRKLDGQAASEAYAEIFGQNPREWAFPPLNSLIRLYPLGLEEEGEVLTVRSPLLVEVDGSFRMNSKVKEGATAHLLVGSTAACLQAVREASRQALDSLGKARPILALVFADIAWRMLFENQPGSEVAPIREIIGANVPISGGYTIGQIVTTPSGTEVLNQHIEIILIGAVD
ncbi:MAG TPA: FIST N-terminal domain-containing protein [Anaerolineales bacterium]|nr:FIST N-terminal domain-containing protein [Anaerolineales bacterium]